MAIAPTATIANIIGVSQSIEPTYKNLYAKANLSGDFTVVNNYLVEQLKERDLWDAQMVRTSSITTARCWRLTECRPT